MKHSRQDLVWERSASLVSAERGDLDNEFIEITEEEANQIVERIRAKVTGASSTYARGPQVTDMAAPAALDNGLVVEVEPARRS